MPAGFLSRRALTLAVHLEGGGLRLALADRARSRILAAREFHASDPSELAGHARKFLKEHGAGPRSLDAVLCVPRRWVILREAGSGMPQSATGALPFAEEETASDSIAGLVVIAPNRMLQPGADLMEALALARFKSVLSPFARAAYLSRRSGPAPGDRMRAHFADGWLELDLVRQGRLVLTRAVPAPQAALAPERWIRELHQSLRLAKVAPSGFARIEVLGASSAAVDALREETRREFGMVPDALEPPDPAGLIQCIGAALAEDAVRLDLRPQEFKRKNAAARRALQTRRAAAWCAAWLAVAAAWSACDLLYRKRRLARVESRLAELESAARATERPPRAAGSAASAWEIWAQLYESLPPGASLSGAFYDSGGRLALEGFAPGLSDATRLAANLERSPGFGKAELKSARSAPEGIRFQIEASLRHG